MSERILVTGGAGYIGSHMVKMLLERGHEVEVFDNLSTGHRDSIGKAGLHVGDLRNPSDLEAALGRGRFGAVLHFAACCYVGESVVDPGKYYENNFVGTINLLQAMRKADVGKLVFSSSCSTYGNPQSEFITESHPQAPVNPYGATKLMCERAMMDFGAAHALKTIALRYFNAAGCADDGSLGERHAPETHLIPLVLLEALRERAAPSGESQLRVFGSDFETPDGTCIRDYVHVSDLCSAHLLALERLQEAAAPFEAFNLGSGTGHSVLEVIETCRKITGCEIRYRSDPRRPGDPSKLVARADLARTRLGWTPQFTEAEKIIETAWAWFSTWGLTPIN